MAAGEGAQDDARDGSGAGSGAGAGPGPAADPGAGGAARESVARTARRRARAEITTEIIAAARRQLATQGAPGLSLRAVARELGMVSSAVYRYVDSRDELLTLLIIDSYDALGEATERAEGSVGRPDLFGRWLAICAAVRDWGLAHPHEYALLYGSPVPGYVAPEATVGPASRVTTLLVGVLADAVGLGPEFLDRLGGPLEPPVHDALRELRPAVPDPVPDDLVVRGLMAWTYLFGAVSFELFGHLHRVIDDSPDLRRAFFVEECTRIGHLVGLPPSPLPS